MLFSTIKQIFFEILTSSPEYIITKIYVRQGTTVHNLVLDKQHTHFILCSCLQIICEQNTGKCYIQFIILFMVLCELVNVLNNGCFHT